MASIKFPRKEFEKHIKITSEIQEKISMFGTHFESMNDDEVELEILPNRPDLFSFQGFIRSFSAFIGKEKGLRKYKLKAPEKNFKVKIDPSVRDVRPFTACAIVKKLSLNDIKIKTLIDIQEKLHMTLGRNRKKFAIGIYPLEKISLPIRFEARKPQDIKFRPLEMPDEMTGLQILQRHPTGREYASLLEGYDKFPVFADSKGNILSMPPIINSHDTGKITESTTEVFIECSGSDFSILNKVLNIIVTTLIDMGGEAYQMELSYTKKELTPNLSPIKIKISREEVNKLSGLRLSEKDIEKCLTKMGYDYKSGVAYAPSWRTDILHAVDVIEDIVIAYGYENLVPEVPPVATIGGESHQKAISTKISEILTGLGLVEISSYHLIKQEEGLSIKENDRIEIENSKTEYRVLRPNLVIPALRIFSQNKDNEYPQSIFEIGTVFSKDHSKETGINETTNLLIASCPSNFTEIKRILDYLAKMLNVEFNLNESTHPLLIEGRTGTIILKGKEIGHIGEVHPETLREWKLSMPISLIEISLEEVFKVL